MAGKRSVTYLAAALLLGPWGPGGSALAETPALSGGAVRSLIEARQGNVILQKWDLSCGTAVLATLLNYQHGDRVSEREIAIALMGREEYLKDPDLVRARLGFSLLDLKRYADQRGYRATGFGKLEFDDLLQKAPIIVPIDPLGYNHFVVFRGALGDRVLLADPSFGNRTMTRARFEDVWIEYPEVGHVGFTVERRDGLYPPNQLAPTPEEFLALN